MRWTGNKAGWLNEDSGVVLVGFVSDVGVGRVGDCCGRTI